MQAMVIEASTIEEQLVNLTKADEGLSKHMQDQDTKLSKLANTLDSIVEGESTQTPLNLHRSQEKEDSSKKQATTTKQIQVSAEGLIPIEKLKDFIMESIKDKRESSRLSLTYAKPYTQIINNLKMHVGYQPPKLQQFDSKGNPRQYVAHFVETCNNVGTYGDYLVKQFVRFLKGEVEKKIIADDEPFTEAESNFADAKFFLKNCIVNDLKTYDLMNDESTTKRDEVVADKTKVVVEKVHPNQNKSYKGNIVSHGKRVTPPLQNVPKKKKDKGESSNLQTNMIKGLTFPVKRIEAVKSSSIPLAGFVAQNHLQNVALPTKRTGEGFDPNAYRLFAKAGYNPNEPSKLEKLPSDVATRQLREGLGFKQPSPVHMSIRRASSNYIAVEDESAASNKPSVFDLLGKSTVRTSVFERLEGVKTTVDVLKEVNLGTDKEPRPTYLSALLEVDEESTYIELLKEFRDVFAWSYKEMPGLDPKVAVHHLAVKNGARPVKQAQRFFRPDLVPLIEIEVNKLIEAGFIREVKYPPWVSSNVPIRKENGQIRVCVDFRDLNNACPKDEFPHPIPELMIDATTGYEAMSFMDGSSGYNQIHMAPKYEELTVFCTPKGIYCYRVMPFGLKNAGATYQRAMQNIFDDLLHKNVECYVDDLVVKSRKRGDHLKDLRMVFDCSGGTNLG
ncbi:uncharacterized protein [Nicotiana tomentosiformis]|uniref:uncharacterized protein n=1 Tax=Nicotiana tomentosiformis TaxID=4098 RepID=UPI00388C6A60